MTDRAERQERSAPSEYRDSLPAKPVTGQTAVIAALRLFMAGSPRREWPALFDRRVHWETVRAWRDGRRTVPQWALDMIAARCAPYSHAERLAHGAVPQIVNGITGTRALNAWRAAGRPQKQKPAD